MRLTFTAAALTLVACGPGGTFTGKVAGFELPVKDAILVKYTLGESAIAGVVLTDVPNACATLTSKRNPKNGTSVLMLAGVLGTDLKASLPAAGDYSVTTGIPTPGKLASALFIKSDATCMNQVAGAQNTAKSGLVKLSAIKVEAGGSAQGSFDLTFGEQNDKTSGSFNAAYCDVNVAQLGTFNCE